MVSPEEVDMAVQEVYLMEHSQQGTMLSIDIRIHIEHRFIYARHDSES